MKAAILCVLLTTVVLSERYSQEFEEWIGGECESKKFDCLEECYSHPSPTKVCSDQCHSDYIRCEREMNENEE
ncbi:unnamed protein product [Calicophoron daubneyi]|uniref:Uncharacterized protein n=1 Tax=Calicophoron daubneyi TaxID=300641 RepID=A0AAV2TIC3_CALDB